MTNFFLSMISTGNSVILFVFGIVVLVLGIYTLYTTKEMRTTKMPPTWIVPETEIAKIHDHAGFCEAIRPRTVGLGVICILYGIYEVFESLFVGIYLAKVLGAVGLLVGVIWVFYGMRKIRAKYES